MNENLSDVLKKLILENFREIANLLSKQVEENRILSSEYIFTRDLLSFYLNYLEDLEIDNKK
jgi:hypothetical protein